MHDGRFKTLEEVLDFYNAGIRPQANLHPLLKDADGAPKRFNFTAEQILKDVRFSDPFKR
jgi:cytochrome c peroxidase